MGTFANALNSLGLDPEIVRLLEKQSITLQQSGEVFGQIPDDEIRDIAPIMVSIAQEGSAEDLSNLLTPTISGFGKNALYAELAKKYRGPASTIRLDLFGGTFYIFNPKEVPPHIMEIAHRVLIRITNNLDCINSVIRMLEVSSQEGPGCLCLETDELEDLIENITQSMLLERTSIRHREETRLLRDRILGKEIYKAVRATGFDLLSGIVVSRPKESKIITLNQDMQDRIDSLLDRFGGDIAARN